MKKCRISNEKLKTMRNYLPQGANKIIANKTGLTPIYISKVLHGIHLNVPVIEEAVKIALEEKELRETLNAKLESLA